MGQQGVEVALQRGGDAFEHVLEVGPRVVAHELGRFDQAHEVGAAHAGLLAADEQPVFAVMDRSP